MNNILMINFSFPPSGHAGVYRTLYFARYLPQNGWKPIILTVPEGCYSDLDYSLQSKVPGDVDVFRVPYMGQSIDPAMRRHAGSGEKSTTQKLSWRQGAVLKIKKRVIFIPDKMIVWALPAYRCAKQIIQQHGVNLIYSSSPFDSMHIVGYLLKRSTGIPWIADFRDPWLHPFTEWSNTQLKIHNIMEHQVMMHADRITAVSNDLVSDALRRLPSLNPGKFAVITNGFDAEDFDNVPYQPEDKFIITHTGRFYGKRSPIPFMTALRQLFSENPDMLKSTRVRFVGGFDRAIELEIKQAGMDGNMELIGHVSHEEAIQYQCNSDLLLLIPGPKTLTLPGKLFEYLASRKPILALTENDTESAALIRETGSGVVVNPDDISQIKRVLYSAYEKYRSGSSVKTDSKSIEKYSRSALTKTLAEVCEEVTAGSNRKSR